MRKEGKGFNRIIVVTGTPGTGKTTFARTMSSIINTHVISLSSLARRSGLVLSYDEFRETSIVNEESLSASLSRLIQRHGSNVIIEGHHVSGIVPRQVGIAFVLRCHPLELWKRLRRRGYVVRKIRENVEAEILDICFAEAVDWFGKRSVCEMDTTLKPMSQITNEALRVLSGKRPRISGEIDWLSVLEQEGRLSLFLEGEAQRRRSSS